MKMITKIEDTNCWICGSEKKITYHHTLPQHLKPINNVIVPICEKCHSKINAQDFQSLYPLLTKIKLSNDETNKLYDEVLNKVKLGGFLERK